ncbi:MAG TPA: DNA polymerase IV [Candidatus Saccharimonadales bacterium]|nr:DNA polymerase IV [Candidatus Saccharimonadales bacterium]
MIRTYFHVDMDAFFVSVEELYDPSLKGKPVVVGGRADQRGVVAAASYAARKYGVHSALPLREAARLCPHAIFLEGHPERYRESSAAVRRVLLQFTPIVEMASIDEAYLDMTGTERLHGPSMKSADLLHQTMKRETQLNCSVGIATARVVAKVASDQAKPNGVLQILPGLEASFLAPLDVRRLPGIGKVTEERLRTYGVRTIGDLAALNESALGRKIGEGLAALIEKARGHDAGGWYDQEVGANDEPKSISHEHTFNRDERDSSALESMLARLTEMVCRRLREHQLHARKVQIKLRYSDFTTYTRGRTLERPTQLDSEVLDIARELFHANWEKGRTVRLIGVQTNSLEQGSGQMDLLSSVQETRMKSAMSAVDALRDRFGETAVSLASGMGARFRERTHDNPAALPGKEPPAKRKLSE